MKTVFWWNIPCAGMIDVLRHYHEDIEPGSLVITGTLSRSRKAMGWTDVKELFPGHLIIDDDKWGTEGKRLLRENADALHVFNGITHPARMRAIIHEAARNGIRFCNMTEAYFNLQTGLRSVLKEIYIGVVLPLRTRRIASRSLGVICLSGNSERDRRQLRRLGFANRDIYPFGYYTAEKEDFSSHQNTDGKIHLLCPGLLEPYKGVDLLIKALKIVAERFPERFICHITGDGSCRKALEHQIEKLGLTECVILEGVLPENRYREILSSIDILVAPGRVEPWGIRVNEAIQRCQGVIVSDGLGASNLIRESGGGALFPSGNVEKLAECLTNLIGDPLALVKAKDANMKHRSKISTAHQAQVLNNILSDLRHNHNLPLPF